MLTFVYLPRNCFVLALVATVKPRPRLLRRGGVTGADYTDEEHDIFLTSRREHAFEESDYDAWPYDDDESIFIYAATSSMGH
jgi:hypothetical protein